MKIFKAFIIGLVIIAVLIVLNPSKMEIFKGWSTSKSEISESTRFSFEYGPNMSFVGFDGGVAIYNGRNIRGVDGKGNTSFDIEWRTNDFDIKGFDDKILFLDRIKRTLILIDKKGGILKQINFAEKPLSIEALGRGSFVVHYVYDLNEKAEGMRVFSSSGKQIKDIQIANITILFIKTDKDLNGFIVSGISIEDNRLYNNIMHYGRDGDLMSGEKTENKVFVCALHSNEKFVLWEDNHIEIRDSELKYVNSIYSDSNIIGVQDIGDAFVVADESNTIRIYSYDGREQSIHRYGENLKGIISCGSNVILYTQMGLEILGGEETYDIKGDILDVIPIDERSLAVITRGEVKILLLN